MMNITHELGVSFHRLANGAQNSTELRMQITLCMDAILEGDVHSNCGSD